MLYISLPFRMAQKMLTEYYYNCKICYQPFVSPKQLQHHEFNNHATKCDICSREMCYCILKNEVELLRKCVPGELDSCLFCDSVLPPSVLGGI